MTASPTHQLDPEHLNDHIDLLFRAAWAMCGSREEAEDLVQETFARVLRKPRLIFAEDDVGYLLRTLHNVHRSACRTGLRRPTTAPLPDGWYELADPRATDPHERLESLNIYAEIAELPEHLRDAVLTVDLVGMSYREAARVIGVKEATLTTRLHRGRRRVAEALSRDTNSPAPRAFVARPAAESRRLTRLILTTRCTAAPRRHAERGGQVAPIRVTEQTRARRGQSAPRS